MKLLIDGLVGGVLAPAAFAAAVLLLLRRLRVGSPITAKLAGAIALSGGFFIGFAVLRFAPLRPEQAWHWLPYAVLLASAAGAVESAARLPSTAAWVLRTTVVIVAGWLLVPTWASIAPHRVWWIATLAACGLLLWAVLVRVAERIPVLRQTVLLGVTCVVTAIVLERSGSAKFAQLSGIGTAILGAFWLVEVIRKLRSAGEQPPGAMPPFAASALSGAAPGLAVLLPGLALNGYFSSYSDVPLASYLLVSAAPAALYAATVGPLKNLPDRTALVVQTLAIGFVLAGALALAFMAESV